MGKKWIRLLLQRIDNCRPSSIVIGPWYSYFIKLLKHQSMKFTLGLLAGIAAGAAIVHYVHTREGRVLIDRIKDDIDGIGDKFSQLAEDLAEKGRSLIGTDKRQDDMVMEETLILVVPAPEQQPQPVTP
jgi:hypothetical protein